ncbi:universal stress protein [Azospirillum doebereinerae]|uniref:Universal stress protein n=1 Tax=Azospirillum doebereinerae TaxID=92933 RepID=A0A433JAI0_9PROT|nr:universal stress protein [Azospirillum doebereinerae]RUQ72840.1 universal stress protein [Azospirillum doebereinerae]
MPIKTILLHLANDDSHATRLAVAAALAKRFTAHVEALYIATPVSMPAGATGRAASYGFMAEATAIAHENAERIADEVRLALDGLSHRWTVAEGDHVALLAERAPYADLAIVGQSSAERSGDRVALHVPDRLPLATACPTLVLPPVQPAAAPIGRNVLIAWKNSRESTHAVRNAMPFLETAESVTVLTVNPPGGRHGEDGTALVDWLTRHGIVARHHPATASSGEVGDLILSFAADLGADLLVMGAYGHSRLREMVLGGATRTVLAALPLPALMSH